MTSAFIAEFNQMQTDVHDNAKKKGWWNQRWQVEDASVEADPKLEQFSEAQTQIAALMLTVTELAEAVEAIRHGNPPDDKIPNYSGAEAECADAVIRLMDLAEAYNWNLAEAIVAKAEMNKGRPQMHGGKIA